MKVQLTNHGESDACFSLGWAVVLMNHFLKHQVACNWPGQRIWMKDLRQLQCAHFGHIENYLQATETHVQEMSLGLWCQVWYPYMQRKQG
jgi:hypothetical protein